MSAQSVRDAHAAAVAALREELESVRKRLEEVTRGRDGLAEDKQRALDGAAHWRKERDAALAAAAKLREEWVEPRLRAQAANTGLREAARGRIPLDGAEAQALEGSLAMTERERDEALAWRGQATTELMLGAKLITELRTERDEAHGKLAHLGREFERLGKESAQIGVDAEAWGSLQHDRAEKAEAEVARLKARVGQVWDVGVEIDGSKVLTERESTDESHRPSVQAMADALDQLRVRSDGFAVVEKFVGFNGYPARLRVAPPHRVHEQCKAEGYNTAIDELRGALAEHARTVQAARAAIAPEPAKAGEVRP